MADSKISAYLKSILSAVYGREVRQSIHDSIAQCYDDVTNPDLNTEAFKTAVQSKIDDGTIAAMTIEDGSITKEKLDPELDFGVKDKTLTAEKFTDEMAKQLGLFDLDVYGFDESDYTAVDITDQFTAGNYSAWTVTENGASGTVLSPIFKTPQKLLIINNNTSNIALRTVRFLESTDAETAATNSNNALYESVMSDRWSSDISAGQSKLIYTHEFGRAGLEYMQIRWTSGSFNSWAGKFQVIAYYTERRHTYKDELSVDDGFEHDVEICWRAAKVGNPAATSAVLFAIVPFVPRRKYTVKGGHWVNTASTNISYTYALYDNSLLDAYYPCLLPGSANTSNCPQQPPIRSVLADVSVLESGASNGGKGIVTYTCPDPEETKDYPRWLAFAMASAAYPEVDTSASTYPYETESVAKWISARLDAMDSGKSGWGYVTALEQLIDRPAQTKGFVNPYVHHQTGDSSKYSAAAAGSSPLCGARWVLFGDSITDNYGSDTRVGDYFVSKISREFGLIPDNRAQAGSNINDGDESYSNLCGINMLDAFLQEIEDGTTEQPDYITIAFGGNSYGSHVGSVDDTSADHTNSICGAMKYFIEKIREKCPGTVFGFVLPYQSDWAKSTAPNTSKDIAAGRQAMLSVLQSEGYQVPYIDMWTQSGITVDMLPDAIHIGSGVAQTLYYHAMRRFMMSL